MSGKRFLVVDDDEISRLVALEILEGLGAEVLLASGPDEALGLVPTKDFDLIVLDLHMPGMHGTELAAALVRLDQSLKTRIIFLTAQEGCERTETTHAAPNMTILAKPLNPRRILEYFRETAPLPEQPAQLRPSPAIDGIDVSAGIRNFMGQEQTFLATLGMFPEYARHFIEEYERNLLTENRKECWRLAHSLKGSSAMIGATGINALAKDLENLCESSHDFDMIRSTFMEIREMILMISKTIMEQNPLKTTAD